MSWLLEQGVNSALANALRPALTQLWSAAWKIGERSASEASGAPARGFNSRDFHEAHGRQWVNQIVQTILAQLARILVDTPDDQLAQAVTAYLTDENHAHLIAVTEVTRAINIAATETYRQANIFEVRWQTEDASACPACIANEEAGPRQLGVPFPSGATEPPQHPHCRCALLPA